MIPESLPPKVRGYLESTRFFLPSSGNKDAQDRLFSSYYSGYIDYLRRFDKIFGIETTVGIVYSDMMRAEAITVDGRSYIVYDRYFGQVVNMLNRLLFYKADKMTAQVYFHKICSQILSRYGFYSEAIFAANKYRTYRDRMDLAQDQRKASGQKHGLYTSVQELFVMLHEQAHVIFKEHPDLLEAARGQATEWLGAYGAGKGRNFSDEELTATFSEKERAYFIEHRMEFEAQKELSREFVQRILAREDLLEEFCCDQMALINVLSMFSEGNYALPGKKKGTYSTKDTVTALILVFLNMRTLQSLESLCALQPGGDFEGRNETPKFEEGMYSTFYSARVHHAKELCYEMLLDDERERRDTHISIMNMMDRHTDHVLGPAMTVLKMLLFDPSLRSEMDESYQFLTSNKPGNPNHQRTVTALLHLMPDNPARSIKADGKRRVRNKKKKR